MNTSSFGFPQLSSEARVWIFQIHRNLSAHEIAPIQNLVQNFAAAWQSHGKPLNAAATVLQERFIVIAADEQNNKAGGCSIDGMTRFLQDIEQTFDIAVFQRTQVAYRQADGSIADFHFNDAQHLLQDGTLTPDTLIYNITVHTKAEAEAHFLQPLRHSWLAKRINWEKTASVAE
ncbi:MAG: hypothetical protein IPL35_04350 [Sphingobacteriales bacterium]|nr:hypothetical protein [Sphingobacteriales bacterium]